MNVYLYRAAVTIGRAVPNSLNLVQSGIFEKPSRLGSIGVDSILLDKKRLETGLTNSDCSTTPARTLIRFG